LVSQAHRTQWAFSKFKSPAYRRLWDLLVITEKPLATGINRVFALHNYFVAQALKKPRSLSLTPIANSGISFGDKPLSF
jgi:hypothetical protein